MRKIEYLSPSSISLFYANLEEFYINYLIEKRPPRGPQTKPMSIGSAFDAYAKSFLHEKLFGKGFDPRFDLRTLFEAQVSPEHRDWAWVEGKYVFEEYSRLGALTDLMLDLSQAINTPKFEIEVKGVVDGYREGVTKDIKGVTLLGKPDVFYVNKFNVYVILDFKVNGYLSNYTMSPMKGYIKLRPGNQTHKDCTLWNFNGTIINIANYLEDLNSEWARQLSIYAWLCGLNVGENFIVAIDQIVGNRGQLRIAEHRLRVSAAAQFKFFAEAQHAWEVVHSNHIFRELTLEDSITKCTQLDTTASMLRGEGTDSEKWFYEVTR